MTNTVKDFKLGQRVQLHPATDLWMKGARYGTVTLIGRKYITVRLDMGVTRKLSPSDLLTEPEKTRYSAGLGSIDLPGDPPDVIAAYDTAYEISLGIW